jgi:hypothetical protein
VDNPDGPQQNCQLESECPGQNPYQPAKAIPESSRSHKPPSTNQSASGITPPPRITPQRYNLAAKHGFKFGTLAEGIKHPTAELIG